MGKFIRYARNKRIRAPIWILILMVLSSTLAGFTLFLSDKIPQQGYLLNMPRHAFKKMPDGKKIYVPVPLSMDTMKKRGCVTDGFLSGYGGNTESQAKLINRSQCVYLHRALETWASPPDFDKASEIMQKVTKSDVIYGMFIAEAIKKNADFLYPEENRDFNFSKMCRAGSENIWGEHTCKPSFSSKEYRKYLDYITKRAIDTGIQSFLFGQIYYQESGDPSHEYASEIVTKMRDYARSKGVQIAIGAQTGSISDPDYLKLFDYIEGGVGIDSQGNIEDGPCLTKKGSCWALLWNDKFAKNAKNVFLHLDWSGLKYDDMSIFARMDSGTREKTLRSLYQQFTSKNMGFMMPFLAIINKTNGGCYGPMKRFYSPDNKYTCRDEKAIDKIFVGS